MPNSYIIKSFLRNPNGDKADNTNGLEHLEQLNDSFIPQISNKLETQIIKKIQRNTVSIQKHYIYLVKHLSKIYQSMKN